MRYFLMNKNEQLLSFDTEDCLGVTRVSANDDESGIPSRITGYLGISDWVERRNYAKHKESLKRWLHEWQLDTTDGFLGVTHALSLNDTLWVKPADSTLTWESVNLYQNEFSDIVERTAFETGLYGLKLSSTSPEFTSEGSFAKCWKRENGTIFLYKIGATGACNVGKEPYSEFYSSQLSKQIQPNTIDYDLVRFKGTLCSKCELFTSEKMGFVPVYRYLNSKRVYTIPDILDFMTAKGFEEDFRRMLVADAVTLNQDRHLGNFGFLVNNETNKIIKFAPLFDYNQSFFCNALDSDLEDINRYMEEYQVGHKLGGAFWTVGQAAAKGLDLPRELSFTRHSLYNLDESRMEIICNYIDTQYKKMISGLSV